MSRYAFVFRDYSSGLQPQDGDALAAVDASIEIYWMCTGCVGWDFPAENPDPPYNPKMGVSMMEVSPR